MIYDLGGRLQTTDFADRDASATVLADLQHEFAKANYTRCVLCLLHHHASGEEGFVFPDVQRVDPAVVRSFLDDHHEFNRRLAELARRTRELDGTPEPTKRVELGVGINQYVNEFFALYLTHMNREESVLVPYMREHFTDAQMAAMRGGVMASMPPEMLGEFLRWTLPALTVTELVDTMKGIRQGAPPPVFTFVSGIGARSVPAARWAQVRERVGF